MDYLVDFCNHLCGVSGGTGSCFDKGLRHICNQNFGESDGRFAIVGVGVEGECIVVEEVDMLLKSFDNGGIFDKVELKLLEYGMAFCKFECGGCERGLCLGGAEWDKFGGWCDGVVYSGCAAGDHVVDLMVGGGIVGCID